MNNSLVFGKDDTQNIVSYEVSDSSVELFIEEQGVVTTKIIPNKHWMLSNTPFDEHTVKLKGNLHYKYMRTFAHREDYVKARRILKDQDCYSVYDEKESAQIYNGFTLFKGMKVSDVSVLSFDIEAMGLTHDENSRVLIISNTFRSQGKIERRLFCYDEYNSFGEMFDSWCSWVREKNPSVIVGHNIYGYDFPYLDFCASNAGTTLDLGRDGSTIKFSNYDSQFRVDGSRDIDYRKVYIYGREIVDTMFLALKYDIVSKKYESYGLKPIIKAEKLEIEGRQFYDAGQIRHNYLDPTEWSKIKAYALHDADDALALYDLMIPSFFYLTQSVAKSFQSVMVTASGSQLNSILVRSYLQEGHSIPKTAMPRKYDGATSLGNPGIYHNVFKIDVASLYPSIMLQYNVCDTWKDPKENFLKMVQYFTAERLANKKKAKETGDKYYKDLEQSQKIVINSAYGLLGTPGLNFNSFDKADFVTRKGREILGQTISWSKKVGFDLVNADTDSVSITFDNQELTEQEREDILETVNSLFPERIKFEDDGYYKDVLVVKIKNYALDDGESIKIKGSALKAATKEVALKEMIEKVVKLLLKDKKDEVLPLYNEYVKEIFNIKDISRWCSKKTISNTTMESERTNETKIMDAIEGSEYVEGDRCYLYFTEDNKLKLREHWSNDHSKNKLFKKLYDSICVFETILDVDLFPNYSLKKNQNLAREIVGLPPIEKIKRSRKSKCQTSQENII